MTTRAMLLAAAVAFAPAPALAQEGAYHPPAFEPVRRPIESINFQHRKQLAALREEALALQLADGGALTPEHRAEVQSKLDRLHANYRRQIARADPLSVNADGSHRD